MFSVKKLRSDSGRIKAVIAVVILVIVIGADVAVLKLSGGRVSTLTAVSLSRTAMENVKKVNSAQVGMVIDMDGKIEYAPLNIGMDVGLKFDIDMEAVRGPLKTKGFVDAEIEVLGKKNKASAEFFTDDGEKENSVTYARLANMNWTKKTKEKKASGTSGNPMGAGIVIVKGISEEKLTAELMEETVEVDGKEAWQMNCVADGVFLKDVIDTDLVNEDDLPFDPEKVEWENVQIPVTVYIYKETKLPARIVMDCSTIGGEALSKTLKDSLENTMFSGINVTISKCAVDMTITRYDEIEEIVIPEEALSAKESKDLLSQILDTIGVEQ